MRTPLLLLLLLSGCLSTGSPQRDQSLEPLEQDENYMDVFVHGEHAYVTSNWGLHIVDISDRPRVVGKLKTPGQAEGIFVRDGYAYIADGVKGFVIANVSKPTSPRLISRVEIKGNVKEVEIKGDLAYLGNFNYQEGLEVVNVSRPREPELILGYDPPGYEHVRDIALQGDLILLADFTGGFKIINATKLLEGENRSLVADLPLQGVAYAVDTTESYALVACSDAGIAAIDISNASEPEVLSYSKHSLYTIEIKSSPHGILATTGNEGILALKLVDDKLEKLAQYDTRGNAFGFSVQGDRIYLADHSRGLLVLDENLGKVDGMKPGGENY